MFTPSHQTCLQSSKSQTAYQDPRDVTLQPLTWLVIAVCSSLVADLTPCCVMKVFRMPGSVFCGYLQHTGVKYLPVQQRRIYLPEVYNFIKKFID